MKRNAHSKFQTFSEKLQDTLEIPQTASSGTAQIELSGNREALIDGCRGVLQVEDTVIRLSAGQLVLRFTGQDLRIRVMQTDRMQITGVFAAIDFTG